MNKHTPGPWKAVETGVYFPDVKGGFCLRGCPDAEANATLCAAAPDLLEALEYMSSIGVTVPHRDSGKAIEKARAAIARARGEA